MSSLGVFRGCLPIVVEIPPTGTDKDNSSIVKLWGLVFGGGAGLSWIAD